MKKILNLLLIFMFCIGISALVPNNKVLAAEGAKIIVNSVSGMPNTSVNVAVSIQDISNLAGAQFDITYDPSVMICTEVKNGNFIKNSAMISNTNNASTGKVKVVLSSTDGSSGSGDICILTFKLNSNFSKDIPINIQNVILNDTEGNEISATLSSESNDEFVKWKDSTSTPSVSKTKEWTIAFKKKLDASSLDKNIYIVDIDTKEKLPVTLVVSDDGISVTIKHSTDFVVGHSYTLYISKKVRSMDGKIELKKGIMMPFTINKNIEV